MDTLPDFLEEFLDIGESIITESIKPSWLLDPFEASEWKLKIPGESRLVNGKWVGAHKLNWRLRVPGGYLTDPCWSPLLKQCKLLVLAHIEGPNPKSSNPRGLKNFHSELVNLAEHLIVHYPNETELLGLASLSIEKIEHFLVDHLKFGTSGTGHWLSRWSTFLSNQIKTKKIQNEVAKWRKTQPTKTLQQIDRWQRSILTLDPPDKKPMPETELTLVKLQLARGWLEMEGWYDEYGCIDFKLVAEAIEVKLSRLATSALLKYHFRPFEYCTDYREHEFKWSYREYLGHRNRTIAEKVIDEASFADQHFAYILFQQLKSYSPHIEALNYSALPSLDLARLPEKLRGGDGRRTPTLPIPTALYIYDHMIQWGLQYSKSLMRYYAAILEYVIKHQGNAQRYGGKKYQNGDRNQAYACLWEDAFALIQPPSELDALNLWRVAPMADKRAVNSILPRKNGGSSIPAYLRNHGLTLVDAMHMNAAVLAGLIAAFSLRRLNEILSLGRHCLVVHDDRTYLDFNLEKVGLDGSRAPTQRPIPQFLFDILQEQQQLANKLSAAEFHRGNDPMVHNNLFIIPTDTGGRILGKGELSTYTDLFCDWIEVPLDKKGRRWYVRTHECRRFGAMSFFHLSARESSLPALAWFMGHRDIKETWRYIQEELTGQELAQCEVAMAHTAILNQQPSGNVDGSQVLSNAVARHFGASRLDLIEPDELDEYLQILFEEGFYRAVPHTVRTANGEQHIILIEIKKEV